MINIWFNLATIFELIGVVLWIKSYFGFRNYQKILDKTKDFTNEEKAKYFALHIKKNNFYMVAGVILMLVSSLFFYMSIKFIKFSI